MVLVMALVSGALFAQETDPTDIPYSEWSGGTTHTRSAYNAAGGFRTTGFSAVNGAIISTSGAVGAFTVTGTLTISGSISTTGDITFTFDDATDEMDILGTNATGQADTPLINVNDDRTGANANTAGEAMILLDAAGTHALSVTAGIVDVDGTVDLSRTTAGSNVLLGNATGDITQLSDNWDVGCTDATDNVYQVLNATGSVVYIDLDLGAADGLALGNNAGVLSLASSDWDIDTTGIITGVGNITSDGTVDANAFTSDAGAGLDTQAAGTLVLGAATATKVEIADTAVES